MRALHLLRTALRSPTASPFAGLQQVRTLMPRAGKTHKGAAARFTLATGRESKGLIIRSRCGKAHLNLHKSSARLRRLRRPTIVSWEQRPAIMRLLGR